jgi:hypothetical protein
LAPPTAHPEVNTGIWIWAAAPDVAARQFANFVGALRLAFGDHAVPLPFIDHDAFQCGYCTPGQICSAAKLAIMKDGAKVTTIEGLATDGALHQTPRRSDHKPYCAGPPGDEPGRPQPDRTVN